MSKQLDQLKHQLRQLTELAESGTLPDDAFQTAKAKLERQILDAVLAGEVPSTGAGVSAPAEGTRLDVPAKVSAKLKWGMLAFVVAVGAGGYAVVGNPGALNVGPGSPGGMAANNAQSGGSEANGTNGKAPHAVGADQITAMAESLAAKLKTDPNNAEGWAMLARSYAVLGRFPEAVTAYQRVLTLRTDDAQVYADYADALAVTQGRKLAGEPAKLVAKALSLDANNFKALSLAGTLAYDQQDFKRATDLWGKALQHSPSDNPELTRQIRSAVDDARQKAGLPALPAQADLASAMGQVAPNSDPQPNVGAGASEASVSGQVSLGKAAAAQVSPDDTVFIFARAVQGPKMPLAILRKQVKDLPATFSLTDAMAMSPQMKLSSFAEVVIGARVSKSGQAMPQAGDWQGLSQPLKIGATGVRIEINEAVR